MYDALHKANLTQCVETTKQSKIAFITFKINNAYFQNLENSFQQNIISANVIIN